MRQTFLQLEILSSSIYYIYFLVTDQDLMTDTAGRSKLVDTRVPNLQTVLGLQSQQGPGHHDALNDSLVLAGLLWNYIKNPEFYPGGVRNFVKNFRRKICLTSIFQNMTKIKRKRMRNQQDRDRRV